jgi:hypothetical protein
VVERDEKTSFSLLHFGIEITGGEMATIQIFSKDLQDLLISFKTEEDWQLEGLEDVETLTDIIREAGSVEIARAIIQFMKKYGYGYSNSRRVGN